jgi:HSP20 family protein
MRPTVMTRRFVNTPLDTLNEMRREMDRLFNGWPEFTAEGTTPAWALPTDVVETDGDIRFMIEIPGLSPEDFEVTFENGVLTVSGEKKLSREEDRQDYRLFERRYGRFERSFRVPARALTDEIEASYEHGVLTIRLPKREESKPRRIAVNVSGARNLGSGEGQS